MHIPEQPVQHYHYQSYQSYQSDKSSTKATSDNQSSKQYDSDNRGITTGALSIDHPIPLRLLHTAVLSMSITKHHTEYKIMSLSTSQGLLHLVRRRPSRSYLSYLLPWMMSDVCWSMLVHLTETGDSAFGFRHQRSREARDMVQFAMA